MLRQVNVHHPGQTNECSYFGIERGEGQEMGTVQTEGRTTLKGSLTQEYMLTKLKWGEELCQTEGASAVDAEP